MSKGTRYTDDFKKQIVALYKSGKQVSKLSREYDVATPTIYKCLTRKHLCVYSVVVNAAFLRWHFAYTYIK